MSQLVPMGFVPTFHAARDPDRPFLTQDGETITRAGFEADANRRARALAILGVGQDDRVIVALPNGAAFFETTFALWKLGATPVPVAPGITRPELADTVTLVDPRAVIGVVDAGGATAIPADLPIDPGLSADALAPRMPANWRISMSGGSTGRPKVIVDRSPAVLDPLQPMLEQTLDGVMLNPGPLYHSGPFGLTMRAAFAGNHIVNMPRFDAAEALALIERHRVDWLYLVPTMMHRIWRLGSAERGRFDLSSLKVAFHMAAACPPWLKRNWIDWLGPERVWELYSGAENPGRCVINGTEWLAHPGSVGKVQPGAELAVFDGEGHPSMVGEVGEIAFRPLGAAHTFSYIGAEPRMVNGFYSLGDMGWLDRDGYLYIADRRTDLIVSGGVNLYPAEIEGALEAHPDVACAVAVGLPDPDLGHRVHAIVELAPGAGRIAADDLRAFLAQGLARYKIPRTIEFTTTPLKNSAGKVRRADLREKRLDRTRQTA